ncbi:MAG: class I SAM-dependent methyltransferase [Crocinitomicaceae bacterium]
MHGFIEIYEPLFEPIRDDSVRIFEIGILRGLSHLMWRNYFQNGEIYGIDLKDYSEVAARDGILTYVADQSNRDDLNAFLEFSGGKFDVILDDGGHAMDHQQVSLGYLFSEVKPGGMFIVEDVHTSLPQVYPDTSFKVNDVETNTTLLMLETFVRTGRIYSEYMTQEEATYLENNIERVELHYRRNMRHSIVCIIHKKEEVVGQ